MVPGSVGGAASSVVGRVAPVGGVASSTATEVLLPARRGRAQRALKFVA